MCDSAIQYNLNYFVQDEVAPRRLRENAACRLMETSLTDSGVDMEDFKCSVKYCRINLCNSDGKTKVKSQKNSGHDVHLSSHVLLLIFLSYSMAFSSKSQERWDRIQYNIT